MADCCVGEPMKLNQKLNWNAERGGNEQDANFTGGEPDAVKQRDRQKTQRCEKESIEHHVLYAHFVQRQASEIKPCTPETACECACAVTEKRGARAEGSLRGHLCFHCRIWRQILVFGTCLSGF